LLVSTTEWKKKGYWDFSNSDTFFSEAKIARNKQFYLLTMKKNCEIYLFLTIQTL